MIMDRRKLLQSVVGVPLIAIAPNARAVPVKGKHYLLFFDYNTADLISLANRHYEELPHDAVIEIIPVKLKHGQTIDDAIKMYEIEESR